MAEIRIERKRRSRAWPLLLALGVLAVVAVGIWLFWLEPERRASEEAETPPAAEQQYQTTPRPGDAGAAQPYTRPAPPTEETPRTPQRP